MLRIYRNGVVGVRDEDVPKVLCMAINFYGSFIPFGRHVTASEFADVIDRKCPSDKVQWDEATGKITGYARDAHGRTDRIVNYLRSVSW
jgi:hypothetical protein